MLARRPELHGYVRVEQSRIVEAVSPRVAERHLCALVGLSILSRSQHFARGFAAFPYEDCSAILQSPQEQPCSFVQPGEVLDLQLQRRRVAI